MPEQCRQGVGVSTRARLGLYAIQETPGMKQPWVEDRPDSFVGEQA